MGKLLSAPKPPQEDPDVVRLRKQEQERAESDKIKAIQGQLGTETRIRNRAFGLSSLIGSLGGNRIRSLLGTG